jgi:hypothetical protein
MAAVRQVQLFADDTAEEQRRILSEEAIARKRAMADALRAQASGRGQIESPWEGLAQVSDSVFAGLADRKADREAERRSAEMARVLSGIDPAGGAISPETIQQALALDPQLGMSLLGQQRSAAQAASAAAAEANKPVIVRPGEIGVNPATGEIVFNNPAAPTISGPGDIGRDAQGNMVFQNPAAPQEPYTLSAGAQRRGTDNELLAEAPPAAAQTINVGGPQRQYDIEMQKADAAAYQGLNTAAQEAQSALTSLSVMENAMKDPNFYSGTGAGVVETIRRGFVALGGDPQQTASMEVFRAQAANAALATMGGSLGSGFSNADRDFVTSQVPSLQNTPDGNAALIRVNRLLAERKVEIAQRARQYAAAHNGQFDQAGFLTELEAWAEQNPLFADAPPPPDQQGQGFGGDAFTAPPGTQGQISLENPPPGANAALQQAWPVMTPEERALWQN